VTDEPFAREEEMRRVLSLRRWAVVGASTDAGRPGHRILSFLADRGWEVFPVNPAAAEIGGRKAYPDLRSLPHPPEVVDLFRRSEQVLPHVREAIEAGAKAVWMQLGVVNEEAARLARDAGLLVVMDRCPMQEIPRLGFRLPETGRG